MRDPVLCPIYVKMGDLFYFTSYDTKAISFTKFMTSIEKHLHSNTDP